MSGGAPIVRYAPSPTGRLHFGNARPALLNWLFALRTGGTYVLRLDDTDLARSTEEFARGIEEDLAWLGVAPAIKVRQSDRISLYDAARDRLIAAGRLYPAYETEDELEIKRGRARLLGKPPIYDRAALALTDAQKRAYEAEGRTPHWRFRLDGRAVHFDDLIKGPQTINTDSMSDPVLIRGDGTYLYTLCSVVDDIDLGITHVIRGEDHVSNTGTQIEIFEALGGAVPQFAHHNLLTGADTPGFLPSPASHWPSQALSQPTASTQKPDAQSAAEPQTAPSVPCGAQVPAMQRSPFSQSAATKQASPAQMSPSQPLGQVTVCEAAQAPPPEQCATTVATPASQLASPHTISAPGYTQPLRKLPSQAPAQASPSSPAHAGRAPTGAPVTGEHLPPPHDSHWPSQALSQHTPSAQNPLLH